MDTIIFATGNQHKTEELSRMFEGRYRLESLKDVGFTDEIIEDGSTFIENSLIKCRAVYEKYGRPVIADDSGIAVEALGGEPGIHSARYGGEGYDDVGRYKLLLKNMEGKDNLNAAFVCALVLYINPNRIFIVQEEVKGQISFEAKGENGFGYDPIFYIPEFGKTSAELDSADKDRVSHRGRAAKAMLKLMKEIEF